MNNADLRYCSDCADISERFATVFRPDEIRRIDEAHFMGVKLRDMSKTELMLALMALGGLYTRHSFPSNPSEMTYDGIPVGPMREIGDE